MNDDMAMASEVAIDEIRKLMQKDEAFARSVRLLGSILKKHYLKSGYKHIARWLKDGAN